MGGTQSFTALVPQLHCPPAISGRFCRRRDVTLRLHPRMWTPTQPNEIRDMHSNLIMFCVVPRSSRHLHTAAIQFQLVDPYKMPIATLERTHDTSYDAVVYPVTAVDASADEFGHHETRHVGVITPHTSQCVQWTDPVTQESFVCTYEGDWGSHNGCFWLQRGFESPRERVARVYRPDATSGHAFNQDYHLDVAAGVDIALLLLICAAFDDTTHTRREEDERAAAEIASHRHWRGVDRDMLTPFSPRQSQAERCQVPVPA
ncbi:hypothetical protein Poli38472_013719 [Pythium oligandrum]|uniref:Uncharacterized protein n=1 Tax=Pythium oligandrum TaxID=41045 RepID=A0A8K1CE89_PYTOL|nr:hypothetical protein Poli38472_013719 [Pythium oligandrum]|eukprot:TMW61256.1 hypothetical protein Poli38472_013719 [Pythium oligandrum]